MRCVYLSSLALVGAFAITLSAQPANDGWELLYDAQIKIRLTDARFTAGAKRLTWLFAADKPAEPKDKIPPKDKPAEPKDKPVEPKTKAVGKEKSGEPKVKNLGPEFLEFREEKSTNYKEGIITYIPVASLERLEYDSDKKLVQATVKRGGDMNLVLVGSTEFAGINKFSVSGTAAKAEVGIAGAIQFQDGLMKVPFRGFVQHGAKPAETPTGRGAVIVALDKDKTEHRVQGLTPVYKVGGGQRLAKVLMFDKVGQLDVAQLATLRMLPNANKKLLISTDYEVTLLGGNKENLKLLESTQLDENQKGTLLGLIGRVPAGYKLFPLHTIVEIRLEGAGKKDS